MRMHWQHTHTHCSQHIAPAPPCAQRHSARLAKKYEHDSRSISVTRRAAQMACSSDFTTTMGPLFQRNCCVLYALSVLGSSLGHATQCRYLQQGRSLISLHFA